MNQEIRKELRKGELAVKLLESLGYSYTEGPRHPRRAPQWTAPVPKEEVKVDPKVALAKFLREQAEALSPTPVEPANTVEQFGLPPIARGRDFTVDFRRIPAWHKLKSYHPSHFAGRKFSVGEVYKPQTASYPTGWAVEFTFETMLTAERVWLPLSACNFS